MPTARTHGFQPCICRQRIHIRNRKRTCNPTVTTSLSSEFTSESPSRPVYPRHLTCKFNAVPKKTLGAETHIQMVHARLSTLVMTIGNPESWGEEGQLAVR